MFFMIENCLLYQVFSILLNNSKKPLPKNRDGAFRSIYNDHTLDQAF